MKKLLLASIFLLFVSIGFSQPGFTCPEAIPISVPFSNVSSTGWYGDTTDVQQSVSCNFDVNENYMVGNDVFYSYTPTASGYTKIKMTPESTPGTAIFIYEDCGNVGLDCFAGAANPGSFPRSFPALFLTAGQTYIIVISGNEFSGPYFTYTLEVESINCPATSAPWATSLADISATFSWQDFYSTAWEIAVVPSGAGIPTGAGIPANTNLNFEVTGLTVSTEYDVYVRADCGNGTFSEWSPPYTFTTIVTLPPMEVDANIYTTDQLVETVLIDNPCVALSNITSITGTDFGQVNGIGYFTNTNPTFPFTSGIVLSSGNSENVPRDGGNLADGDFDWLGDSDLDAMFSSSGQTGTSKNATVLEFDFTSNTTFLSFNFLFASEEYGIFQCSFSDAFAFFLTDLVTGTTTNLAVVPNTTTPVSTTTVRDALYNSGCSSVNDQYFDTLFQGSTANEAATNFVGQTMPMTASSAIIANHPYHIKMVVADYQDPIYDSAVFIQTGSFSSGPASCLDRIRLLAFVDANSNGIKDIGELDFTYGSFVYQINNSGNVYNVLSAFADYTIYSDGSSDTYDFSFEIDPEYSAYYSVGATNFNDLMIATGSGSQTLNFPITLTQPFTDVSVTIVPLSQPVAGSTYLNKIVYRNDGVSNASGTLTFTKGATTSITSISQAGTITTPTGFTYNFSNLLPYEARSINVTMSVPGSAAIGDLLTTTAAVTIPPGDISASDNIAENNQIVSASYDPNDKTEVHGPEIPINEFSANEYLYYTVRFQNIGTANAVNVRIEDILDAQLDAESIRMVSASHPYIMERVGNNVVWTFDNIQLPGALQNLAQSIGYITFKIKVNPGFAVGDIIPNIAEIYFDSNAPIITNTFNTEFTQQLSTNTFNADQISVYPNPANNLVYIKLDNATDNLLSITLYDVVGKSTMKVEEIASAQTVLDVSKLAKGIYIAEILTTGNRRMIKKLVIQ